MSGRERVSEWAGEQADVLWFMIETGTMFTYMYIQYMHAVWSVFSYYDDVIKVIT